METKPKPNEPKKKQRNALLRFTGLAFQMGGTIGALTYLGIHLDRSSQREFPIYTLVLSLFSVFVALYMVIRYVQKEDWFQLEHAVAVG
jgi:hypothetical protein